MKKTIKEWFEESNETWAKEALAWTTPEKQAKLEPSIESALADAFDWQDTYHGHDFWDKIHTDIM